MASQLLKSNFSNTSIEMTTEQYCLLSKYANDLDIALMEYFDQTGCIPTEDTNLSDIIQAAVNMMHLVRTLPIPPVEENGETNHPF